MNCSTNDLFSKPFFSNLTTDLSKKKSKLCKMKDREPFVWMQYTNDVFLFGRTVKQN